MIVTKEFDTNTLLLGGILAICSMECRIVLKMVWELTKVFVFAMLEGPATFFVSF